MEPFRFRLARWIMNHRGAVGIAFIVVTLFFAAAVPRVDIRTIFSDLLPADDPFVQVFKDHPNFGSPLTVSVMIKRKEGPPVAGGNGLENTIYHQDTLQKVWDITRDIDLVEGVDHDQIISIATEKARYAEATPFGIDMRPLMGDKVPSTPEEVADLRRKIEQSPNARVFYVSRDETATIVNAAFQESLLKYDVVFAQVNELVDKARDANHEIYVAGQPMLTGWVYHLQKQTYTIFGVTLGLLVLALMIYMRNIAGLVTPIVCSAAAAIWGFGLVGWIGHPIEPLLMIVPLLLIARSFSHCVQYTERYYEVLYHIKDRRKSAEITMGIMMAPSILGIMTDVFGIAFIALAPIPTMHRHAFFCGFWAFWIIPTGVFLISILLSYLPAPKNLEDIVGGMNKEKGFHVVQKKLLAGMAHLSYGKPAKFTTAAMVLIGGFAVYQTLQIKIGNPMEGSNLLWYDSEFNTAVRAINSHFPGVNTLEIILEAKKKDLNNRVARTPKVAEVSAQIQAMVEADPVMPPRATLSFTDYMMEGNRLFAGGHPKWLPLDPTVAAVRAAGTSVTFGTNPVNFGHISDFQFQSSTISLWYKDNKQETVDGALASARRAVAAVGEDHPEFRVRLASGFIALQQAMNIVVERYHWFIFGMVNLAIGIISALVYRSVLAAIILLIPVNLSNFMMMAAMHLLGVGLDINAVIVAVMGVGVGIDYGIYLLSRICEEYTAQDHNWEKAIYASLTTTGKAIMFTASIMLIGVLPWYFLSGLKFMADMGILIVTIMLINMLLSLIVLPLIVWLIKPKFAGREDLIVGESIDLSKFITLDANNPNLVAAK